MRNSKIIYAFLFCFTFLNSLKSQQEQHFIDSLRQKIKNSAPDTNKVNDINKLAFEIKYNMPDSAGKYLDEAIQIAEKYNYAKGLGVSYKIKGILLDEKGLYKESVSAYLTSISYSKKVNDSMAIARTEANIGIVLRKLKDNKEAIGYFRSAYAFFEGKKPAFEINVLGNIGICYMNLDQNDSALFYQQKAYAIMIQNKLVEPNVYGNLGLAYLTKKNYSEAEPLIKKCLEIKRRELNDPSSIAVWSQNLAAVYIKTNRYDEAIKLLQEAILLFGKNKYVHEATYTYNVIVQAYEHKGDIKNALKYHKILAAIKDSIYSAENSSQVNELKEKYETEKKETEIKLLTADKATQNEALKKNRIIIYSGTALTALLIVFALFIFRNNRQKQKINKELVSKNILIENQKKEVEAQKEIVEEKQKEILDSISYAKRLQQAILPPDDFIKQFLPGSFIYYQPKDIVAGDFYWIENIGDKVLIAAADCTGHGVPGAMVSVVCSNALNRTVKEFKITEPGKILDKVRELVIETFAKSENEVKDGMDISLISIDRKPSIDKNINVQWAGANNPLWYFSNSEMQEIKANKQPIGKTDNPTPFKTHQFLLNKNDLVYLFTDGYADQFGGEKGKKFKYKQLNDLMLTNIDEPVSDQKTILKNTFNAWKGSLEQVDDVCIIGIRL